MRNEEAMNPLSTIRFSLKPEAPKEKPKPGEWITLVPADGNPSLPAAGRTTVEGMINGLPFKAAIEPDGAKGYRLQASPAMRRAAAADVPVQVEIMRAGDEPETRVPADLRRALTKDAKVRTMWEQTTPIARRDWIYSIAATRNPETRHRRIAVTCDKLACGKGRVCCFGGINWLKKTHKAAGNGSRYR